MPLVESNICRLADNYFFIHSLDILQSGPPSEHEGYKGLTDGQLYIHLYLFAG